MKGWCDRLVGGAAWVIVAGLLAVTLFGWLWPARWQDQSTVWVATAYGAFIVRTLSLHIAIGAAALAAGLVVIRRPRAAVVAMPAVLMGFGSPVANMAPESGTGPTGTRITVMTANLFYRHPDVARVLDQVRAEKPDIIFWQEYDRRAHEVLSAALGAEYPFRALPPEEGWGHETAIYSKIPLDSARTGVHPPGPRYTAATAMIGGREVTLLSLHLRIALGVEYFRQHRADVVWCRQWLERTQGPVILAGDFNATPNSQTGDAFRGLGMRDAFASRGGGLGFTWPAVSMLRHLPGFRIDRVLHRGGVWCERAWVGAAHGSDHRPVFATLIVPDGAGSVR
ncbi:MAG TPA: hypothetical protein DEB06_04760 [Phycisphaerales bacterium]|nr:hypothetical protein [Phycisphaerales bacterium]